MSIRLGVVMDPIGSIKIQKDSTFAMLLAAQARGWELHYMELQHLHLRDAQAWGEMARLTVRDDTADWFSVGPYQEQPLDQLDVILMRKDPPFDMEYVYATYILERAEVAGALVVNKPAALRDANEKLFTAWFPEYCPSSLVTRSKRRLRDFLEKHQDVIVKPLGIMGGTCVFRVRADDPNIGVIFETLTSHGTRFAMAQRYIPEIKAGDKRILLIDGEPIPYALARIPAPGETRGNLAAGGRGEGIALSKRDWQIGTAIGPELRRRGLLFVGLDVIGDYLTEINVTSPTCIRELDALYDLNIADRLLTVIANRIHEPRQTKVSTKPR